jgi:hypothetical protein
VAAYFIDEILGKLNYFLPFLRGEKVEFEVNFTGSTLRASTLYDNLLDRRNTTLTFPAKVLVFLSLEGECKCKCK